MSAKNLCFAFLLRYFLSIASFIFYAGKNFKKKKQIFILFLRREYCNILMYISSFNTWASGDFPLAQLVKELALFLYLCVIEMPPDQLHAEPINNFSKHNLKYLAESHYWINSNTLYQHLLLKMYMHTTSIPGIFMEHKGKVMSQNLKTC